MRLPRLQSLRVVLPAIVGLSVLALTCTIVGLVVDATTALWLALVVLVVLYLLQVVYLGALGTWLAQPSLDTVPNGIGVWSEIFVRLHRWQRASERGQRRLADNEERFRRTISALPDGILLIDAAYQIEWCNPVAERHLAISLRSDQGLRLTNLVRDPPFVAYLTSGSYAAPLVFRPLTAPAAVLSVTMLEFEPARSIIITRDVTQSERVEAMRREFVANVSHELRTPLTVIKGFLESFVDMGDLGEARAHHLHLMSEQAERMHRLIEDLLMLSRLESERRTEDETVDVGQLVAEVAVEARSLSAGRHEIDVTPGSDYVRGARDELRSAFANLVSNAVRYTPAGGRIALAWVHAGDEVGFQVQDSGIGIAAEHMPRLTERFYRVEKSRSRETGGTGLGLAIVKHVLLRHEGRLEVRSEPGKGSTFTAWLPRARQVVPESATTMAAAIPGPGAQDGAPASAAQ